VVRGRLICFIGIDGSGKTTLSKMVVGRLREGGERAVYAYGRSVPVVSRLLMAAGRKVFLKRRDVWGNYSAYAREKKRALKNALLAQAYRLSVWTDYLPQVFSKIETPLLFGKTMVCDRYVFDTVVSDLGAHLEYDVDDIRLSLAAIFRLLPEPDMAFLVDLPEEVALGRKDDVPHLDYLRERRQLYLLTAQLYPMFQLDGMESPEVLVDQVLAELARRPERSGRLSG